MRALIVLAIVVFLDYAALALFTKTFAPKYYISEHLPKLAVLFDLALLERTFDSFQLILNGSESILVLAKVLQHNAIGFRFEQVLHLNLKYYY